jgi:predicted phosphoribosyltransferase
LPTAQTLQAACSGIKIAETPRSARAGDSAWRVVTGAVLARELDAELDVVLSRKLRAPFQPELAIGAVGEDGEVYLNHHVKVAAGADQSYIDQERKHQLEEIARRQRLFRAARFQAPMTGRSIILTDDGIATGSTMIAALHVVKTHQPHEVIVAVPVAPPERLEVIRNLCDRLICLLSPEGSRRRPVLPVLRYSRRRRSCSHLA